MFRIDIFDIFCPYLEMAPSTSQAMKVAAYEYYQIKKLYANMFSKLHALFLIENVVGDNVILVVDSQDTHANAEVLQTTTTPMYIRVVFGDHDIENIFLV